MTELQIYRIMNMHYFLFTQVCDSSLIGLLEINEKILLRFLQNFKGEKKWMRT